MDLLDTAAARVKLGLTSKPPVLVNLDQAVENLKIEITSLEKDDAAGILEDREPLEKAKGRLETAQEEAKEIEAQWNKELDLVKDIIGIQDQLTAAKPAAGRGHGEAAARRPPRRPTAPAPPKNRARFPRGGGQAPRRDGSQVEGPRGDAGRDPHGARPRGKERWWPPSSASGPASPSATCSRNEAQALLDLEKTINERVVGQEHWASRRSPPTLRGAKLGLGNPEAPMGVFLVTGPSGVGKTEVARAISDILFGGEKFVVTINMSEYQDSMSITQLKGASAGYVGYGDGGVLTEGVRKRPYTVVILDEVEKAHKDVLNMFYQVFDKGMLRDGEGRDINFRNTVILMTSNLGLDTITALHGSGQAQGLDDYRQAILQELTDHFAPALLARCKVVPFLPLDSDVLKRIVFLKLMKLGRRLMERHKLAFAVAPEVVRDIVILCTVAQSGARNIDTIIDQKLMPEISRQLLSHMAENQAHTHLFIGSDGKGGFLCSFSNGDFVMVETPAEEAPAAPTGEDTHAIEREESNGDTVAMERGAKESAGQT